MKDIFSQDKITLEPGHIYKLADNPDQEFISGTTLVSKYCSKFDELATATKLVKNNRDYAKRTVECVLEEWKKKREHGTLVHSEIENHLIDGRIPSQVKSIHGIEYLLKYKKKYSMSIIPEAIIYAEDLGIAGTIDLLSINKFNQEVEIIDWKTGSVKFTSYKGEMCPHEITHDLMDCNFEKYTLQLSLYRYMLEKYYGLKVINQIVAHITDDECIGYVTPYRKAHIKKIIVNHKQNKGK